MRFLACLGIACALVACGHPPDAAHPAAPDTVSAFPAARWIPANPTYLASAPTMRDGQRALADLIDTTGTFLDVDSHEFGQATARVLGVNVLSADAMSTIGIDLAGNVALFSEDVAPTFVVHLSSPEALAAFFEQQRAKGLVTQSVLVDGAEVFSARLVGDMHVSWAVDHDWLWVHFALPHETQGAAWFAHSHHPDPARWAATWAWVRKHGSAQSVQGFFDLHGIVASVPDLRGGAACVRALEAVHRVGFSAEGDLHQAVFRLALDVGSDGAAATTSALVAPPTGWAQTTRDMPLSAEWNLDLGTAVSWLAPCADLLGQDPKSLIAETGIRAARAFVKSYDPDDRKAMSGAAVLDVTTPSYFARFLDKLDFPGRSMFEKSKKFGPYAGKRLAPPMFPAVEYSLGEHLVLLGVGDGLLDQIVAPGTPAAPPVFSFRILPPALPAAAWAALADLAGMPHGQQIAAHLGAWREGHITLTVSGPELILEAAGMRR